MATTRLILIHRKEKCPLALDISNSIEYGENPKKTDNKKYISSYSCGVETAAQEFIFTQKQYQYVTDRLEKKSDIIMYQIRQSFKPGEITAEEANRLGYELAMRWTKGKHQFIVATHIDKSHIHNHIYINSVDVTATKKFKNFKNSAWALRRLSDTICIENGYSIVEAPKQSKSRWSKEKKSDTHQELLCKQIDIVLSQKPKDFDTFLTMLQKIGGYEIKKGKYIAFKAKEWERYTRLRNLGEGYTEEDIKKKIEELSKETKKEKKDFTKSKTAQEDLQQTFSLLIDIQEKLKSGKGKGYEVWAKKFNLKQMANTLLFIQEKNLDTYDDFQNFFVDKKNEYHNTSANLKRIEKEIEEKTELRKAIINYMNTKDVYRTWKENKNQNFYREHETELIFYESAKKIFDTYLKNHAEANGQLPGMKLVNVELQKLYEEKQKYYSLYRYNKREYENLLRAKANIDTILGMKEKVKNEEKKFEKASLEK